MSSTAFELETNIRTARVCAPVEHAHRATPAVTRGNPARYLRGGQTPLNRATTLPAQAYTSEEFFAWELEHVLRAGWQCVAHVSQIQRQVIF